MIARNSLNANVPRCPWARARLALPASAGFPAARMWLRCQFVTGCLRLLFAGGCLPCVRGRARARCGVWLLGVTCRRLWPLVACCGYLRLPVATCSCLWPRVVACGRLRLLAAGWRRAGHGSKPEALWSILADGELRASADPARGEVERLAPPALRTPNFRNLNPLMQPSLKTKNGETSSVEKTGR